MKLPKPTEGPKHHKSGFDKLSHLSRKLPEPVEGPKHHISGFDKLSHLSRKLPEPVEGADKLINFLQKNKQKISIKALTLIHQANMPGIVIKFIGKPAMCSAVGEIDKIKLKQNTLTATLNIASILNSRSPLPTHYLERILLEDDDQLIQCFIQCLEQQRLQQLAKQLITPYQSLIDKVLCFAGMTQENPLKAFYPMLIGGKAPKQSICWIIQSLFNLEAVWLEENILNWRPIPQKNQTHLAKQSKLGNSLIGNKLLDASLLCKIHIQSHDYQQFTYQGATLKKLKSTLQILIPNVDIQIFWHLKHLPSLALGMDKNINIGFNAGMTHYCHHEQSEVILA